MMNKILQFVMTGNFVFAFINLLTVPNALTALSAYVSASTLTLCFNLLPSAWVREMSRGSGYRYIRIVVLWPISICEYYYQMTVVIKAARLIAALSKMTSEEASDSKEYKELMSLKPRLAKITKQVNHDEDE